MKAYAVLLGLVFAAYIGASVLLAKTRSGARSDHEWIEAAQLTDEDVEILARAHATADRALEYVDNAKAPATGRDWNSREPELEVELPLPSTWIHALDPAKNLAEIAPGWIPTVDAWREHVAPLVELCGRLTLAEARHVLQDRPELLAMLEGDGTLGDRIGVPTDEDVLELWQAAETRDLFATALWAWGYSTAILEERRSGAPEPWDATAEGMLATMEERGKHAWAAIFEQRTGYRWWPLLAEVGLRLEYGEAR